MTGSGGQSHAAKVQQQNPATTALRVSFPLPDCCLRVLAARATGIPKVLSMCEPQLQSDICNEGEKLHLIIGFPFRPFIVL